MNSQKFTISKLIEHAERAYREYGDIQIAIRVNESVLMAINGVGIAGLNTESRNVDDTFLCFVGGKSLPEVGEEPLAE